MLETCPFQMELWLGRPFTRRELTDCITSVRVFVLCARIQCVFGARFASCVLVSHLCVDSSAARWLRAVIHRQSFEGILFFVNSSFMPVCVRHDAPSLVHVPTHHSHCFSICCLQSCVCARSHRCLVTNSCDHLMAQVTLKRDTYCTRVRSTLLNVFHGSGAWSDPL